MIYEVKKSRFQQKIFFIRIEIKLKINPISGRMNVLFEVFVYKITKKGKKFDLDVFIG